MFHRVCVTMADSVPSDFYDFVKKVKPDCIKDFSIELSNNSEGQGFSGEVVYVRLTDRKSQEQHCIAIKQERLQKSLKRISRIYDNEILFYDTVWPTLHELYRKRTGKFLEFIPKYLGASKDQIRRIAMEDLKAANFVTLGKTKTFSADQIKLIFNTYGIFHGISMSLKEQNGEEFFRLLNSFHYIWDYMFAKTGLLGQGLVSTVRGIQRFFDSKTEGHLTNKLLEYEKHGPELVSSCLSGTAVPRVITHGDCWTNNMMFRNDENNQVQDIKLLDFQLVCGGSPVHDLSYCFYSSGSGEDFDKLDYYLKIYLSSLSETLKEFGLDARTIYSFRNLKEEWRRYSKFGFSMALMVWKTRLADPRTIPQEMDLDADGVIGRMKVADAHEEEYRIRNRDLVIHMYKNEFI